MSYSYSYKKEIECCKCSKELTPDQMQSCFTVIFAIVDIAAIILGFQDFIECSNEIYKPKSLDLNLFCIIGGFTGLFFTFCSILSFRFICRIGKDGYHNPNKDDDFGAKLGQTGVLCCQFMWFFSWSVVGFVLYSNLNGTCKSSGIARGTLAWSVIKLISSIFWLCACLCGIAKL